MRVRNNQLNRKEKQIWLLKKKW